MKRKIMIALLMAPLVGLAGMTAARTSTENDEGSLARELGAMNRSLQTIAQSLQRLGHQQDVVVLLRRIEIKERRLLPRETALRNKRDHIVEMRGDIENYGSYVEGVREQIQTVIRDGGGTQEANEMLASLRREETEAIRLLEGHKAEIEERESAVLDMEDELEELRDEIEELETALDSLLGQP
jgi:chromosome segregation ATPase